MSTPNWYSPPESAAEPPPRDAPAEVLARVPEYAGFAIRVGGQMIDLVFRSILAMFGGVATGVILAFLQGAGAVRPGWSARIHAGVFENILVGMLSFVAQHTAAEWIGGATLGKLLLGLRVRTVELAPCTFAGAVLRNVGYWVDAFFFGLVAYGSMSKSPMQQRLGDKWGGTVVVKAASISGASNAARLALGIAAAALLSLLTTAGHMLIAAM